MKLFLGVCLALAVAVSALDIGTPEPHSPVFGYHSRIGVAAAARIKKLEEASVNQRIVGGRPTHTTQFDVIPHQAGLVIQFLTIFQSVCGATFISNTRLVTAAHCQFDGIHTAQFFTVVFGSRTVFSGGVRIVTRDVVMHPNFNPTTTANDIAVIRIPWIPYNDTHWPIRLNAALNNEYIGRDGTASGYGLTDDVNSIPGQSLNVVTMPIITNAQCAAVYGPRILSTHVCTSGTGGRGICSGDSGGPLVYGWNNLQFLVGVSLFHAAAGCSAGHPSVYTKVGPYVNWIQSQ